MLVSTNSAGYIGDSHSIQPSISADGRYVAFSSDSIYLAAGDTNGITDIFVKDTQTGGTSRISTDSSGGQGNSSSNEPSISADGRYVAFSSGSSNLAAGDTNGTTDIFVKDTQTGGTTLISTDSAENIGNSPSYEPSVSADGHYVAFSSNSSNLVAGDTNVTRDIFVKDTLTGSTTRISTNSSGGQGNRGGTDSSISADGRYVAFSSDSSNLVAGDTNGSMDIFVKNTLTGGTARISTDSNGAQQYSRNDAVVQSFYTAPSISGDGRYVAFSSNYANLVSDDTNDDYDILVKDTQTGGIIRSSTAYGGDESNAGSNQASISADGQTVAFQSNASNLVWGDNNGSNDVFAAPVGDVSGPIITNKLPEGDLSSNTFEISADFSDAESGIDPASVHLLVQGVDITSQATITSGHISLNTIRDGTQYIQLRVSNNDHSESRAFWLVTTPAHYYFPWYDSQGGKTWVMMAQPFSGSPAARENTFDVSLRNMVSHSMEPMNPDGPMTINKGQTEYIYKQGAMGGPVMAVTDRGDGLVSERSLFGNSFEEVWGTSSQDLDSHYWWPVYDGATPGMQNWVLVANPPDSSENVTARVRIHGTAVNVVKTLTPGESWTPAYPGVQGGPVEVTAWKENGIESSSSDARKVIASQRVLYRGAFNEMPGIAASRLDTGYIWTWYDNVGGSNWIVIANPSPRQSVMAVVMAGDPNNPIFVDNHEIAPNSFHAFQEPGGLGGPVYAFGYMGPYSTEPDAKIIASQRVLWGPSFGELAGMALSDLHYTTATWTWYDQLAPGVANWVMIANPSDMEMYAEVRIAGVTVWGETIGPFDRKTPSFAGKMGGPVEVESWVSDIDPATGAQRKQAPYLAFASQRVLWNGYFNEVVGKGM